MSKERGQRNRDLFLGWVAEMKSKESPNWLDYWHGDTLSPKKIADELGFDSSAFKEKRNKKLFDLLQELKQELDKMASTSYALSGSLQTIDYFMSKTESKSTPNEPVTDNNELSESDK